MTLKSRIEHLEQAKRRHTAPVLLWQDEGETLAEARERAGLQPDDPVRVLRWMTADEAA